MAGPQMPNLQDIYSMNPGAFYQSQQFVDNGLQADQASVKKQQLANMFDEKNDPLRLEHQRGLNESLFARVPGERANSQSLELKAQRDAAGQGDAISLARKKFLQEASDADIKMLGNKAQEMAYSPDPKIREQGMKILSMHKDILAEKEKQNNMAQRQLELERLRGANARQLQQEGIAGGRYAKGSGSTGRSVEEMLTSGKLSYEKAATVYEGAAFMAEQEGDEEKAAMYRAKADDFNRKHIAAKQAGANAGAETKPDLATLGIKPNTPKPIEGFSGKKPVEDIQKLLPPGVAYEPNKFDYRINPETGKVQRKPKG